MAREIFKYEAMFLLNNGKLTPENRGGIGIVSDLLTKHSAQVAKVEIWDERKLAYPIQAQKRGTYVLAHFELKGSEVKGLSHDASINEDILRSMVTRIGDEYPPFRSYAEMAALRPKKDIIDTGRRRRDDEGDDDMGGRGGRWRDDDFGNDRDRDD